MTRQNRILVWDHPEKSRSRPTSQTLKRYCFTQPAKPVTKVRSGGLNLPKGEEHYIPRPGQKRARQGREGRGPGLLWGNLSIQDKGNNKRKKKKKEPNILPPQEL